MLNGRGKGNASEVALNVCSKWSGLVDIGRKEGQKQHRSSKPDTSKIFLVKVKGQDLKIKYKCARIRQ